MKKINAGVYGARGYTGGEVCRLLLGHTNVSNIFPSSGESEDFERIHPNLKGSGLRFIKHNDLEKKASGLDVVFLCTKPKQSIEVASKFLDKECKVVDLSAAFRLSRSTFEQIYEIEHKHPELLREAAYGASELNREEIKNSRLVANPGCYVITGLIGLAPLLKDNLIDLNHIPINAINGMTGADSKPRIDTMQTKVHGNILSYNMEGHRHSGEFEEKIKNMTGQKPIINFNVGHGDFTTGIHLVASPLIRPKYRERLTRDRLLEIYNNYYRDEKFVRVNDWPKSIPGEEGKTSKVYDVYPQIRNVKGTNFCDVGLDYDPERGIVKVVAVADNLVRGSAGSAIQNMNLMFGFDEVEGLRMYATP